MPTTKTIRKLLKSIITSKYSSSNYRLKPLTSIIANCSIVFAFTRNTSFYFRPIATLIRLVYCYFLKFSIQIINGHQNILNCKKFKKQAWKTYLPYGNLTINRKLFTLTSVCSDRFSWLQQGYRLSHLPKR